MGRVKVTQTKSVIGGTSNQRNSMRSLGLKRIGYEGTERLSITGAADALEGAARYRKLGMDFATCLGPTPQTSIRWTAALGKTYVWTAVSGNTLKCPKRLPRVLTSHPAIVVSSLARAPRSFIHCTVGCRSVTT